MQCNQQPRGPTSSRGHPARGQWKRPPSVSVYDGGTQYLWQGGVRAYVYKRNGDKTVYLGAVEISQLPGKVKVALLKKFLEKALGAEVANAVVNVDCKCKVEVDKYLGYLTTVETAKRLKIARYVSVEKFRKMLGGRLFKKLVETGAVPMFMCTGGKYAIIDFDAFVKFAEEIGVFEEVATKFVPEPDVVPLLEQLVKLGLAKKFKMIYVMPKTAITLFRLSEEIIENVFFADDKFFISMPQVYSLRLSR